MSNPLRILQTLDKHLNAEAEITLFGRAALALGYPNPPASFHNTQDVDGILPLAWLEAEDAQEEFWHALQETNQELESTGVVSGRPAEGAEDGYLKDKSRFWGC